MSGSVVARVKIADEGADLVYSVYILVAAGVSSINGAAVNGRAGDFFGLQVNSSSPTSIKSLP